MPRTSAKRVFRSLWVILACAMTGLGHAAATVSILVQKADGQPLPGAVVMLTSESPRLPPAAPLHASVDQVDLAFAPDLVVLPVGSTVSFPNSDAVSHQVYSFSSARRFQLPLYRGRAYPPVTFDTPGIVTLGCNIHDNMLAYVVVTEAPFFGRTDERGQWQVANAPPGSYRVKLWHPLLNESAGSLEKDLQVDAATGAALTLRLAKALRPAPLKGRPHSWDY